MKITNMMRREDSSNLNRSELKDYLHAPLSFERTNYRHRSFKRRRNSRSCNQAELKLDDTILNKTHTNLMSRNLDKSVASPNVKSEERDSKAKVRK